MSDFKIENIKFDLVTPELSEEQFQEFKNFIKKHPKLKINSRGIQIQNDQFQIYLNDAKVNAKGPDDKIYGSTTIQDHNRIREEITRGCILIQVNMKGTDEEFENENKRIELLKKKNQQSIQELQGQLDSLKNKEKNDTNKDENDEKEKENKKQKAGILKAQINNLKQLKFEASKYCGKKIFKIYQGYSKFSGLTDNDDDDTAKMQEQRNDRIRRNKGKGEDNKKQEVEIEQKEILNKDIFYLAKQDSANKVIQIGKENGKAFHFTSFKVGKTRFFVGGSKNVHVLFRNKDDLIKNLKKDEDEREKNNRNKKQEDSTPLHYLMCFDFLKELEGLEERKKEKLFEVIEKNNFLCNFEYMCKASQHIVSYDFAKGKNYIFRFLSFTCRKSANQEFLTRYGKLLPVEPTLKFAEFVGFEIPKYKIFQIKTKNDRKKVMESIVYSVRQEENSEGSVLYFMDKERTIGLSKTKSYWYIMIRAIREKVKRRPRNYTQKIKTRFQDIKKWLKLDNDDVKYWRCFAWKFWMFLDDKFDFKKTKTKLSAEITEQYAVHVREFLVEAKKRDSKYFVPPKNDKDLDSCFKEIKEVEIGDNDDNLPKWKRKQRAREKHEKEVEEYKSRGKNWKKNRNRKKRRRFKKKEKRDNYQAKQ